MQSHQPARTHLMRLAFVSLPVLRELDELFRELCGAEPQIRRPIQDNGGRALTLE